MKEMNKKLDSKQVESDSKNSKMTKKGFKKSKALNKVGIKADLTNGNDIL